MKSLPLCSGLIFLSLCSSSRAVPDSKKPDVAKTESDIRTQYENQGFTVEQVNLVKESDRRLSGFVKIKNSSGLFNPTLMKNCVATRMRIPQSTFGNVNESIFHSLILVSMVLVGTACNASRISGTDVAYAPTCIEMLQLTRCPSASGWLLTRSCSPLSSTTPNPFPTFS